MPGPGRVPGPGGGLGAPGGRSCGGQGRAGRAVLGIGCRRRPVPSCETCRPLPGDARREVEAAYVVSVMNGHFALAVPDIILQRFYSLTKWPLISQSSHRAYRVSSAWIAALLSALPVLLMELPGKLMPVFNHRRPVQVLFSLAQKYAHRPWGSLWPWIMYL